MDNLSIPHDLLPEIQKLHDRLNSMAKFIADNDFKMGRQVERLGVQISNMANDILQNIKTPELRKNKSETIGELAKALSKAQLEIGAVTKGSSAHRSKFASYVDMKEVCAPVLEKYGLSTTFDLLSDADGEVFFLTLTLMHGSGEWKETTAPIFVDKAPESLPFHQRIGYAEKYVRRYMYRAMLDLAEESE